MSKRVAGLEAALDAARAAGQWDEVSRVLRTNERVFQEGTSAAHPTPEHVNAYRYSVAGEVASHRRRFDEARRCFLRALAHVPTYADALVLLALLNIDTGAWPNPDRAARARRIKIPRLKLPSLSGLQGMRFRRKPGSRASTGGSEEPAAPAAVGEMSEPTSPEVAPAGVPSSELRDSVALLTRARLAALDGCEHLTQYRLHLRLHGLHVLSSLHERGYAARVLVRPLSESDHTHTHARDDTALLASGAACCAVAYESSTHQLGSVALCLLAAAAAADTAWSLLQRHVTVKHGLLPLTRLPSSRDGDTHGAMPSATTTAVDAAERSSRGSLLFAASSVQAWETKPARAASGQPTRSLRVRVGFLQSEDVMAVSRLQIVSARLPSLRTGPTVLQRTGSSVSTAADAAASAADGPFWTGPRFLQKVDARCRDAVVACVCRLPLVLHRLGDMRSAIRAYRACLEWAGPIAAFLSGSTKDVLVEGLMIALVEGARLSIRPPASVPRDVDLPPWSWAYSTPSTFRVAATALFAAPTPATDDTAAATPAPPGMHATSPLGPTSLHEQALRFGPLTTCLVARWALAEGLQSSAPRTASVHAVASSYRLLQGAFGPLRTPDGAADDVQRAVDRLSLPSVFVASHDAAHCALLLVASRPRQRFGWSALALALGIRSCLLGPGNGPRSRSYLGPDDAQEFVDGVDLASRCWMPGLIDRMPPASLPAASVSVDILQPTTHAIVTSFLDALRECIAAGQDAVEDASASGPSQATALHAAAAAPAPSAWASSASTAGVNPAPPSDAASVQPMPDAALESSSSDDDAADQMSPDAEASSTMPAVSSALLVANNTASPTHTTATTTLGVHVPDSVLMDMGARIALVRAGNPVEAARWSARALSACRKDGSMITAPGVLMKGSDVASDDALRASTSLLHSWRSRQMAACHEVLAVSLLAVAVGDAANRHAVFDGSLLSAGMPIVAAHSSLSERCRLLLVKALLALAGAASALIRGSDSSQHGDADGSAAVAATGVADDESIASSASIAAESEPSDAHLDALLEMTNEDDAELDAFADDGDDAVSLPSNSTGTPPTARRVESADESGLVDVDFSTPTSPAPVEAPRSRTAPALDVPASPSASPDAPATARRAVVSPQRQHADLEMLPAERWSIAYHAALAHAGLGDLRNAMQCAVIAVKHVQALQHISDISCALPWALLVNCIAALVDVRTAASVLYAVMPRYPNCILLRLLEARCAERMVFDDDDETTAASSSNVESAIALVGIPRVQVSTPSSSSVLDAFQQVAAAATSTAWEFLQSSIAAPVWYAHACDRLAAGSAPTSPGRGYALLSASEVSTEAAAVADMSSPEAKTPAHATPHVLLIAVAAQLHVVRVACALEQFPTAARALASAAYLCDATSTPIRIAQTLARAKELRTFSTTPESYGTAPSPMVADALSSALASAQTTTGVDPALRAELLHGCGLLHEAMGNMPAAESAYTAACAVLPGHVASHVRLADMWVTQAVCSAQGVTGEQAWRKAALQPITHSVEELGASQEPHVRTHVQSLIARSEGLLSTALRAQPEHTHAWHVQARMHAAAGRFDASAEACFTALRCKDACALLPAAALPWRVHLWQL